MSLEYNVLNNCAGQLATALKSHIKEMAYYLYREGFIGDELHQTVLDPGSMWSTAQKADQLGMQIRNCVKLSRSKYHKLVNYLRQNSSQHDDIVHILDSEYFGIRKLPSSRLPGQTGILCKCTSWSPFMLEIYEAKVLVRRGIILS